MSGVEFEEEQIMQSTGIRKIPQENGSFWMADLLIKVGATKDRAGAVRVMLITSILFFVIAIVVFGYFVLGINPLSHKPSSAQIKILQQELEQRIEANITQQHGS